MVVVALLADARVDLAVVEVVLAVLAAVELFVLDPSVVFLIAPVDGFEAGLAVPFVSLVLGANFVLADNGILAVVVPLGLGAAEVDDLLAILGAAVSVFVMELTFEVVEFVLGIVLVAGFGLGFVVGLDGAKEVLAEGVFLGAVAVVGLLFGAGFLSSSLAFSALSSTTGRTGEASLVSNLFPTGVEDVSLNKSGCWSLTGEEISSIST